MAYYSTNAIVWLAIVGMGVSGLLLVGGDPTFVKSQASQVGGDQIAVSCSCECQGETGEPLCAVGSPACSVGELYSFVTSQADCAALEGEVCTPNGNPTAGQLVHCQATDQLEASQ